MDETLSRSEISHYTNLWCRQRGIHARDLESHPRADEVVALLRWRELMWSKLNSAEQGVWAGYWSSIYHKKNRLSAKAIKKLETITSTADHRYLEQQIQKAKIRALRQNPNSKPAYDMTAKDVGLSQTVPWE